MRRPGGCVAEGLYAHRIAVDGLKPVKASTLARPSGNTSARAARFTAKNIMTSLPRDAVPAGTSREAGHRRAQRARAVTIRTPDPVRFSIGATSFNVGVNVFV